MSSPPAEATPRSDVSPPPAPRSEQRGAARRAWVGRWAREPLVHFATLGVLALVADRAWAGRGGAGRGRIAVSTPMVDDLRRDFRARKGRAPTVAEESAEVDRYVDDEVLFRTALALGLHEGDPIVRRRLIQRMHFLHEDAAPGGEPGAAELEAYVTAHAARYAAAPRVSFDHVFLARSKRGGVPGAGAAALEALRAGEAVASDAFPHPLSTVAQSEVELARVLGPAVAAAVVRAADGAWVGPIESAYGEHFVRVTGREAGGLDPNAARARALHDWAAEQRRAVDGALVAKLRADFAIVREAADEGRR